MPAGTLRHALFRAFWDETASLLDIEDAFARVTARRQAVEPLRKFFASWSKTNNSAASVSGLANRLTLLARSEQGSAAADQLYRACGSLQRITDEDLGALGNTVHADLFYTMATTLCGDDRWLLRENCLPSAQAFKDWTDRQRLRERDLMQGLLTTLVHEVYTHGEVEYIHPLYKEWFSRDMGVPAERPRHRGLGNGAHRRHREQSLRPRHGGGERLRRGDGNRGERRSRAQPVRALPAQQGAGHA